MEKNQRTERITLSIALSTNQVLEAIQQAHAGGSPMSGHIARKVVQSFRRTTPDDSDTAKLSDREQQVLELFLIQLKL